MELESYNILPVILNDLSHLQQGSLVVEDQQSNLSQQEPLSRTTSNTGAVLLLRCSDEAFDVVLRSLDEQELQLAVILLERQAELEEQTQGSLSHLSKLFRQTNVLKYLVTTDQVMASQQRLASVRSRLLRCISKQIAAASDGQIEPTMEPLINRVLRYPDLSHQYVCSDNELLDFNALRSEDSPLQQSVNGQPEMDMTTKPIATDSEGAASAGPSLANLRSLSVVKEVIGRLSPLLEQVTERTSQCSVQDEEEEEANVDETSSRSSGEQPPAPPRRGSSFSVLKNLSRSLSESGSLSCSASPPPS